MKLSEITGGGAKGYRPTGPIPGDPDYKAAEPVKKPSFSEAPLRYALTQGNTVDPDTAKGQLGRDAVATLESTAGFAPGASAVGRTAAKAAPLVAKGAEKAGTAATDIVGSLGTHTGGESIREAIKAGYEGGQRAEAFLGAMRGKSDMSAVVESARQAVSQLRVARAAAYKTGMGHVTHDPSLLNFNAVDRAVDRAMDVGKYKSEVVDAESSGVASEIKAAVDKWKGLDPREYHGAEGFDALKRSLNALWQKTEPGTAARKVVDDVQRSIKDTISDQSPIYAKVMKDYHEASDSLREFEKGLSLGAKSTVDAALRKLQSVMRNNVNTNYGNRTNMVKELDEAGSGDLMPQLAGHSLSSLTPRGIGAAVGAADAIGASYTHSPLMAASLIPQSPRLMGEAGYYAGKGASMPKDVQSWLADKGGNWFRSVYDAVKSK